MQTCLFRHEQGVIVVVDVVFVVGTFNRETLSDMLVQYSFRSHSSLCFLCTHCIQDHSPALHPVKEAKECSCLVLTQVYEGGGRRAEQESSSLHRRLSED